jgi:hypothetical protein
MLSQETIVDMSIDMHNIFKKSGCGVLLPKKREGIEAWVNNVQMTTFVVRMTLSALKFEARYRDKRNEEWFHKVLETCEWGDCQILRCSHIEGWQ